MSFLFEADVGTAGDVALVPGAGLAVLTGGSGEIWGDSLCGTRIPTSLQCTIPPNLLHLLPRCLSVVKDASFWEASVVTLFYVICLFSCYRLCCNERLLCRAQQ